MERVVSIDLDQMARRTRKQRLIDQQLLIDMRMDAFIKDYEARTGYPRETLGKIFASGREKKLRGGGCQLLTEFAMTARAPIHAFFNSM